MESRKNRKKQASLFRIGILMAAVLLFLVLFRDVRWYVVVSGSMEPAIQTGSLVLVKKAPFTLAEGDIITFRRGDGAVTHRIAEITDEGYVTKGDANDTIDEGTVTGEEILGKYVAGFPYLGYAVWYLRKPVSVFLLLFLIMIEVLSDLFQNHDAEEET